MPRRPKGKPHSSRNKEISRGINRFSRSEAYSRSGRWAVKNKKAVEQKKEEKKPVTKTFGKKNETRVIAKKAPRTYPTEDFSLPLPSRKSNHRPTRLRSSITPGTVLIVLAGRFRGKRVIFLKQLASGLLLVTGPYKVNGVPLRRINQAYVVATAKKVAGVEALKIDNKYNDDYFKKPAAEKKKKTEAEFFAQEKQKKTIAAERVADQKTIDKPILDLIKKEKNFREYLKAKFSLKRGQFPHDIKF